MNWKKIDVKTIDTNAFQLIGDEWMLVTAKNQGCVNTMTASWGGIGIMWGKPVATAYIRPQRYTREFMEAQDTFTLSFFGGAHKDAMGYLGKVSGRDEADKITTAGLHVTEVDEAPTFEEAALVLVCKKRYVQEMKEECFAGNEEIEKWYPNKDYHVMYMAEITGAYVPEGE